MILLPALNSLLKPNETKSHGTTLMSVLFLSIISSVFYAKNVRNFNSIWLIIAGGILGGIIGAKVITRVPYKYIRVVLGIFMIITGIKMLFAQKTV
jgi:uncharacterized membrane protein YfcA